MYLPAKFGGHRPCRNGDINSYINSYMDTFEKSYWEIFKIRKSVYIYEVPDIACRKTRRRRLRRRILTITKRFALHINATNPFAVIMCQVNIKSDIC